MPTARRITGRHLLLDGPGAVIEVPHDDAARVLGRAKLALEALGWPVDTRVRVHRASVTIGVHAPVDGVEAAFDLLEWADGDEPSFDEVIARWRATADPALRRLFAAFPGLVFEGEGLVTVGHGRFSRSWPLDRVPSPAEVGTPRGVPIVTITGTNGKTTTTRLVAHIVECAGLTAGRTSSDAVVIGQETVERGDWTGPGAARRVLRDPRVAVAVLETARGGILRRGLVLEGADVAVLTNVTPEHLGEWGVDDLETMAWTKLALARGLRWGGTLVLPAESDPIAHVMPRLRAARPDLVLRTFSSRPRPGGPAADGWADDHALHVGEGRIPLAEIPITFGGTARHNVENALCAALAALSLGLPADAVARGLRTFRPSVADNPGRMNTFRLPSGALVVLDFAHNADGLRRITETVRRWPRAGRVLLIGQAGDRTDDDLIAMAAEVPALAPHTIVLKDVTKRLYDREPGEVPAILRKAMLARGVPESVLVGPTPDEALGVHLAVRAAGADDVIVLLIHETLVGAVGVLEQYGAVPIE
jgi:cyanophycin synthetase